MRVWYYHEADMGPDGELFKRNDLCEITEDKILEDYWDHWRALMERKYGPGHYLINKEKCIEDWVIINWAWEKK